MPARVPLFSLGLKVPRSSCGHSGRLSEVVLTHYRRREVRNSIYRYRKIHIDYRSKFSYRFISSISIIYGNTSNYIVWHVDDYRIMAALHSLQNKCWTADPDRQNLGWSGPSGKLSLFSVYKFWQNYAGSGKFQILFWRLISYLMHIHLVDSHLWCWRPLPVVRALGIRMPYPPGGMVKWVQDPIVAACHFHLLTYHAPCADKLLDFYVQYRRIWGSVMLLYSVI